MCVVHSVSENSTSRGQEMEEAYNWRIYAWNCPSTFYDILIPLQRGDRL